jgi:hypothetical protein
LIHSLTGDLMGRYVTEMPAMVSIYSALEEHRNEK